MKTRSEYKEEIAALDKKIQALNDEKRKVIRELIKEHHPLRGKTEAVVNYDTHQGKKMRITRLGYSEYYPRGFTADGTVLKKDGTETAPPRFGMWKETCDYVRLKERMESENLTSEELEKML